MRQTVVHPLLSPMEKCSGMLFEIRTGWQVKVCLITFKQVPQEQDEEGEG